MDFSHHPPCSVPFFFPQQQGRSSRPQENGQAKRGDTGETLGIEQEGDGRGRPPVCETTSLLSPAPWTHSALLLCVTLPASDVEGGLFVCAPGCSFVQPLPREGGVCASPPSLCLLPVWSGKEGCEGNGDPCRPPACLSPTLSLPCPSLENAKIHDVNKKYSG